jgi:hypothetical protein
MGTVKLVEVEGITKAVTVGAVVSPPPEINGCGYV